MENTNSNRFLQSINTDRKFDFASYFKDDDPRVAGNKKKEEEDIKEEPDFSNFSIPMSKISFNKFGPINIQNSGFNNDQIQINQQSNENNNSDMLNMELGGSYTIEVPAGVRYLSDWKEFSFSRFLNKSIIDKQIPGCGMTEYSLTGPEYVILCSPRKLLLQNKKDQHGNDVFLVKNEMESDICVDIDINNKKAVSTVSKIIEKNDQLVQNRQYNEGIYTKIFNEFYEYITYINGKPQYFTPYKILVTYDSYHIIKDILIKMGIFDRFYTVVDEFQSILHDARFKSTTELGFLRDLELDKPESKVLFVSATPILEEYIKQLKSFKDLPFYTLDWYANDPTRVIKPDLDVNYMPSINSKSKEIIDSYLSGNYDSVVVHRDGQFLEVKSTEAVFYVNSVNHILNIIANNGLTPDQVNILCADTEDNRKKIKAKLGKGFNLGHIPVRGEQNKMFTFCTRTVYLGADFYSTCAKSFIFSDSNSDCLSVDISEDLPQILGRQRDNDNPWKNSATFFYKTTADYKKMTQEDFDKIIKQKLEKTNNLIKGYENNTSDSVKRDIAEKYQEAIKVGNYKRDYVSVDLVTIRVTDENGNMKLIDKIPKPIINDLVLVNEIRAFRIQQLDYKDRFTVFSTISNKFNVSKYTNGSDNISQSISEFFNMYDQYTTAYSKLKFLCEYSKESTTTEDIMNAILSQIPDNDELKSVFIALGPDRLYSLGYKMTDIRKELGIVIFNENLLIDAIYSVFRVGDKFTLAELKNNLSKLYKGINYNKNPKAKDIESYFGVKQLLMSVEEGGIKKRAKGYELVESYEDRIRLEMKMTK